MCDSDYDSGDSRYQRSLLEPIQSGDYRLDSEFCFTTTPAEKEFLDCYRRKLTFKEKVSGQDLVGIAVTHRDPSGLVIVRDSDGIPFIVEASKCTIIVGKGQKKWHPLKPGKRRKRAPSEPRKKITLQNHECLQWLKSAGESLLEKQKSTKR